jgi:hypothetical protein
MRYLRGLAGRPDVHCRERYGKDYCNKRKRIDGGIAEREPGPQQSPV